jgi:nucleotide-binding universal stress UspA family protein
MKTNFERTVEKPLRLLLHRDLLDAKLPISPSRIFERAAPAPRPTSWGGQTETASRGTPAVFHRVLVPTDFSCASTRALQIAEKITRALHGKLTLLHVNLPVHCDGTCGRLEQSCRRSAELERQARDELQEQLLEIGATLGDDIEAGICDGHPHIAIIGEALTRHIDLIVIAKHGRADNRALLLGKTAEYVVRHAPCPVLLVGDDEFELPDWAEGGRS